MKDEVKYIVSKFKDKYPDRKVTAIKYAVRSFYMVEAPSKNVDVDYNNPYFMINVANGKISGMSPLNDLESFEKLLEAPNLLEGN